MPEEKASKLEQEKAEQLVRFFWLAYNNINMYSGEHPLAVEGAEKFFTFLTEVLKSYSSITFHIEGDSLICEEFRADKLVVIKRLIERFKTAGIHSCSFQRGIELEDAIHLLTLLMDSKEFKTVNDMSISLEENNIKGVYFNYFTYKKVTADDGISKNSGEILPGDKKDGTDGKSLNKGEVETEESHQKSDDLTTLMEFLIKIISDDQKGLHSKKTMESVLKNIPVLKREAIDTYPEGSSKSKDEIIQELNFLIFDLVLRYFRKVVEMDDISPDDFGAVIKSVITDISELQILLPEIGKIFKTNELPLTQYIHFLDNLAVQLGEDGILALLDKTDGRIGISLEDIFIEIKNHPESTSQLAAVSAKISDLDQRDRENFLSFLSEHVELAIQRLAQNKLQKEKNLGIENIKKILFHLQDDVMKEMELNGLDSDLILELYNRLSPRFNVLLSQVWSESMIDAVSQELDQSDEEILDALAKRVRQKKEFLHFLNSLLFVLENKGYKKEQLDRFISVVMNEAEQIEGERPIPKLHKKTDTKKLFRLPKEILNSKETKAYLQREIYRSLRYVTPFSCLSISVSKVCSSEGFREPTMEELAKIVAAVTKYLSGLLRNLDLIGSLGPLRSNHLLIIMTMTHESGAQKLMERLNNEFDRLSIELDGSQLEPKFVLTPIHFDKKATTESGPFIRKLKNRHRKKIKESRKDL